MHALIWEAGVIGSLSQSSWIEAPKGRHRKAQAVRPGFTGQIGRSPARAAQRAARGIICFAHSGLLITVEHIPRAYALGFPVPLLRGSYLEGRIQSPHFYCTPEKSPSSSNPQFIEGGGKGDGPCLSS